MNRKWVVVGVVVFTTGVGLLAVRGDVLSMLAGCGDTSPKTGASISGLWVMDADGSHQRRLTEGRGHGTLAWSPDSTRMVSFNEPVIGSSSMVVATVDGSGQQALTGPLNFPPDATAWDGEVVLRAHWSPDGNTIFFVASPAGGEAPSLYAIRPDGTGRRRLFSDPGLHDMAWSPDGTKVALSTGFVLSVMNVDGSGRTVVARGPGRIMGPAWSPASDQLVFGADADTHANETRLEVINADGSGRRVVTAKKGRYLDTGTWSPDGRWIVFDNYPHEDWGRLSVVRPDGTDRHDLTAELGKPVIHDPAWSPDGTRIAYIEEGGLAVVDRDHSRGDCLTGIGRNQTPVWSPDGTKIAYFQY